MLRKGDLKELSNYEEQMNLYLLKIYERKFCNKYLEENSFNLKNEFKYLSSKSKSYVSIWTWP